MKVRCTRCGRLFPGSACLPLVCGKGCGHQHFDQSELEQVDAPPGLPQMALTAATAYTKWVQAGMPRRSADEVSQIGAICRACPLFKNGRCLVCGCFVRPKSEMATEHCPLSVPKW